MTEAVRIGNATLYCGDCRDILPMLGPVDGVVTDPPYGQSQNVNVVRNLDDASGRYKTAAGRSAATLKNYPPIFGDEEPFDPAHLLDLSEYLVIWGAHRFYPRLPDSGSWLIWDKMPNGKVKTQGCGEAAWCSVDQPLRIFRHLWDGLCIASGYETRSERKGVAAAKRVHPMQKPVDLMIWCIRQLGIERGTILDPYLGGGSTGIAASLLGLSFIGIEKDPRYFDVACRRIADAQSAVAA